MTLRNKLLIALLIASILFAMSSLLTGTSEICAYYGGNLTECK